MAKASHIPKIELNSPQSLSTMVLDELHNE